MIQIIEPEWNVKNGAKYKINGMFIQIIEPEWNVKVMQRVIKEYSVYK